MRRRSARDPEDRDLGDRSPGGRGARDIAPRWLPREPPRAPPRITGVGLITALGVGADTVAEGMRAFARDPSPAPFHDPAAEGIPAPPFPLRRPPAGCVDGLLDRSRLRDIPRDPEIRLAAAAILEAEVSAGIEASAPGTALVATCEAPGMDVLLRGLLSERIAPPQGAGETGRAFERLFEAHHEAAYATHSFLHAHMLARLLGIHGPVHFINNACASGLYALELARLLLGLAGVERVFCVASESPAFPAKHAWFARGGLASPDGWLRPFDPDRSGLVLAEGAAAVVLERAGSADRRAASAWADYLGGAVSQEAWKVTVPSFAEAHLESTVRAAIEDARLAPGDIDVVLAHGAGTALSDAYEARCLQAALGPLGERPRLCALKGYFGHTLGASALLELAALLAAMRSGFLPETAGFQRQDPKLGLAPRGGPSRGAHRVLKSANGFAGFNAASVLEIPRAQGPQEAQP